MDDLLAIARIAAWKTAEILLAAQQGDLTVDDAGDGPVTNADRAANECILTTLQSQLDPAQFGYLSEETYKLQAAGDRPQPLGQPAVWIIDPLDGTKDFIQKTGEFAVHLALVQGGRPVLAVVGCPAQGKLYYAIQNQGTFVEHKNGSTQRLQVSPRSQVEELVVVTSRSHRSDRFNRLMAQFPAQNQLSVGSLGGKIAAIVEQRADVYVSLSGASAPKDWDLAAPELILTEAGGQLTRFDGSRLTYNGPDVSQWGGLLATNGCCHQALCAAATEILATIDPG